MKKAKIMLSVTILLVIVSGAFAFEASKVNFGVCTIYSCNTVDRLCDITVTEDVALMHAGTPGAVTYSSVTTDPNVACVTTCPSTVFVGPNQ